MLVKDLPAPLEITGDWLVTFQAYKFDKLVKKMGVLHSWSDDADTRNFSGTARYELEFEIPPVAARKRPASHAGLGNGDGCLQSVAEQPRRRE